jgi:cupin 2 domain-containing protein
MGQDRSQRTSGHNHPTASKSCGQLRPCPRQPTCHGSFGDFKLERHFFTCLAFQIAENDEGTNLFADLPRHLPDELLQTILVAAQVRIERIVSQGHASPEGFWYDQDQHEWVVVLRGAARLRFEGEEPVEMNPGDFINIPAHKKHRVEWTTPGEPTIWLAVHYGRSMSNGGQECDHSH